MTVSARLSNAIAMATQLRAGSSARAVGLSKAATQGSEDPVAAATEVAEALVAAGFDPTTVAQALVAPSVYPNLMAQQLATVMLSTHVAPNLTRDELGTILRATDHYTDADINAALEALYPAPPVPSAFVEFNGHPDGTGSYALVGDAPDSHLTTNLTIEAMIRWHGANGYAGCVSKPRFDSRGSSGTGYALCLWDGKPMLGIITASGANRSGAVARTPIPANVWTAVSVTYDGKRALTYVDGVEVGRQEWPNVDNIAQGSTGILIGREFLAAYPERAFGGDLADVRIWNQALSAETIAAWRGKPSLEGHPNLGAMVGRWLFNEGQGKVAKDSSGHGHDATLANGAAWHPPAPPPPHGGKSHDLSRQVTRG
jgi:hypothetical protein